MFSPMFSNIFLNSFAASSLTLSAPNFFIILYVEANDISDSITSLNIQIYSVSENLDSSIKNINIKKRYFGKSDLFKTFVGIHPQYASLLHLESFSDFFKQNIDDIDGIGESGLDPSYTFNNV